ncbi:DUF4127 family protein [Pseudactinotalea sp. Z1748]|uniref:DUF4127 family protein n=1 Tax=Pseudactinotalea sp. Z1748 TaxID=3413027 RepID=UPI003C7CF52A
MTMPTSLVVTLLPIDDRPVNTTDVAALADISGVDLRLPPTELLPPQGEPSDRDGLGRWLRESAAESDAVVVSINQLAYGGYVASRRTTEATMPILERLGLLRSVRAEYPELPIHGFMTLMRTRQRNGSGAEPHYCEHHGADIFALSRELYLREHNQPDEVERRRGAVPEEYVTDFMTRRMRLHTVHLACLDLALDRTLDTFWILVEDSTVQSVSTSEREWITAWIDRLGLADRVTCLPGADEAGGSLLIRSILGLHGRRPKVLLECAATDGLDRIALYEDVPVRDTVEQQIAMAGAELVAEAGEADLVLALHPPAEPARDWCWSEDSDDQSEVEPLIARIDEHRRQGRPVAVADAAHANGADPSLIRALREGQVLEDLAGYAGWNTAGNSIGSALAQGLAHLVGGGRFREPQRRSLTRRLLDDWAYQTIARRPLLQGASLDAGETENRLMAAHAELGLPADYPVIRPGSTRFPWDRSFEIAFDLVQPNAKALPQ